MLNLRCQKNEQDKYVAYLDTSQACFSSQRAAIISVSVVALIFLVILSSIYRICIYDHKISPSNHFAQLNSVFVASFHLGRTILMILFILIPDVFFTMNNN